MNNLSTKERVLIVATGLALLILIVSMFVVKPLNNKYMEMNQQYQQLQAQKAYYEQLKSNNNNSQSTISELENDIVEQERTFLPEINTESIEQYVMSVFEENGNPYLVSISSESVAQEQIPLPDGTYSSEKLILERITVEYSTTDGYCIPQANGDPSYGRNGIVAEEAAAEAIAQMGAYEIEGYDEFIAAVKELSAVDPQTIKIHSVGVQDTELGYNILTCVIDFYATELTDRVSEPDLSAPYVSWNGETNVDTTGGLIGAPLLVTDSNSEWFGVQNMTSTLNSFQDRPFATYFSSAIFTNIVNNGGLFEEDGSPSSAIAGIQIAPIGSTVQTVEENPDSEA